MGPRKVIQWIFRTPASMLAVGLLIPADCFAQEIQSSLKTIYFNADYGLTTHKSELVESNDTGSSLRYSLGLNVGDQKQLGVVLQTESSTINFLLNETSTAVLYRDTRITYRLGYFYIGVISAYAQASAVAADGTDIFSGQGSGTGFAAGAYIPVGGRSLMQIDITSAGIADFLNKDENVEVKMGSRMVIDIAGHIPISKRYFNLDLGYRQRTQPFTVAGTSTSETVTTTYVGFSIGNEM